MSKILSTKQAGLTLVELCVTLAITAILAGLATPAMKQFKQRQQLQAMAQSLMTDLQQARSEAVQRGMVVQFSLSKNKQGSCYIIHTGPQDSCSCDERGAAVCTAGGQVLKAEWISASRKLTVSANVSSMGFDARQGNVTPTATIEMVGGSGESIRHIVNVAGRVRSCSPSGSFGGLSKCASKAA